jgi:hypothetical protein
MKADCLYEALSVIASKAKQSRLGPRNCGLVWVASLSLAMTTSAEAVDKIRLTG